MRPVSFVMTCVCAALLSACANLAPDYTRTALPVPQSVDGEAASSAAVNALQWERVVIDARMKKTIDLALTNSRNLRIAVLNIQKARAQYQIDDAARYPALSATASETSTASGSTITRKFAAGLGVTAYEIDFFGRLANLKDASLESFLAMEATQRSVRIALVAEVATAWLTLASNQDLLKLARETLESRNATLDLTRKRQTLGSASQLTVAQAQAATETARGDVARYIALVEQSKNALNLLAGTSVPADCLPPSDNGIGASVLALLEVPAGLSSEILLRRPDVLSAEHALIGSHASIGAARAAFFPSISLTGSFGSASSTLETLFESSTRAWTFVPTISLPIFNAGKLSAALTSAEVTRDIQVATYEKTIQTAFREVADALAERRSLAERMAAQQAEVDAYTAALRLSMERYRAGADSYLTVLDSQRSLYSSQKSLIALQLTEQSNRMTLFKVLAGE